MSTPHKSVAIFAVLCAVVALTPHSFVPSVEAQGATLIQVNAAADRRAIDARLYGVNWASPSELAALNVPVNRWGGNSTTRHNWKQNTDNRGADWYFESIVVGGAPGAAFDDFAQGSFDNGAEPMVTIPLIGWVGKPGPGGSNLASFSAAKYGAQQECDWTWFPDACNGVRTDGTEITGNNPNDASVLVDPQYQKEWAEHLVSTWGSADAGGVRYYLYDNEPALWHATHRDVHPEGQTMVELRDLMIAYGTAIQQADPGAILVGPELYGWSGFFYSGFDHKYTEDTGCYSCSPDRDANGGWDHAPWILDQMRRHEESTGNQLLHLFTLHYYPQGGEFDGSTSASMQALRNRSTRSLWDPNYTDESWINERVRLIPLMKEWVDAYYPGLDIGITEYNWGAHNHINGATAQADVLGIFGREGLNVGTLWTTPSAGSPAFKAIQMYRNYDGQKSTFGDVSVRATGPNPDQLAVFAAERSSDGALTVMAINKVTSSTLVDLDLANFSAGSSAQVWRLTSSNDIQRLADVGVSGGAIGTTLPAQSITLFVIPSASAPISTPFGFIDTPAAGATGVVGAIPVTGWALDDTGVDRVEVWRDVVSGESSPSGELYVGAATFVTGARPDIASAYPLYPNADRAGWGFMLLTNMLPGGGDGTYTLHVDAIDGEGQRTRLGSRTITCDNANATTPFGMIDTPTQGGTVSGSAYVVFGWALTPLPAEIPTDGSTIWVYVDGTPVGHPIYDQYRSDIATLFPGYANSGGAVGYYVLDTTTLANGIHSLAWGVTDDQGRVGGLGSRYFWVEN